MNKAGHPTGIRLMGIGVTEDGYMIDPDVLPDEAY